MSVYACLEDIFDTKCLCTPAEKVKNNRSDNAKILCKNILCLFEFLKSNKENGEEAILVYFFYKSDQVKSGFSSSFY